MYDFVEYVLVFGLSYMEEFYEIFQGDEVFYVVGFYLIFDLYGLCFCEDNGFGLVIDE